VIRVTLCRPAGVRSVDFPSPIGIAGDPALVPAARLALADVQAVATFMDATARCVL
jgi:hypothetical protein